MQRPDGRKEPTQFVVGSSFLAFLCLILPLDGIAGVLTLGA